MGVSNRIKWGIKPSYGFNTSVSTGGFNAPSNENFNTSPTAPGFNRGWPYIKATDVPQSEANALAMLYFRGDGPNWTDNTNWLTDSTVGNWYGITVSGGHVTRIELNGNNGSGDISSFDPSVFTVLVRLYLNSNSFEGDLSGWSFADSVEDVFLSVNSFDGDLSGWSLPAALVRVYLNDNSFSGDTSGWVLPATAFRVWIYANSFSGNPDISSNTDMIDYRYNANNLSQSDVDAVLASVYNNRNDFTGATPELDVSGSNAAPSGTYQYAATPSTGLEYAYALENDDDSEGYTLWTITYTAP